MTSSFLFLPIGINDEQRVHIEYMRKKLLLLIALLCAITPVSGCSKGHTDSEEDVALTHVKQTMKKVLPDDVNEGSNKDKTPKEDTPTPLPEYPINGEKPDKLPDDMPHPHPNFPPPQHRWHPHKRDWTPFCPKNEQHNEAP